MNDEKIVKDFVEIEFDNDNDFLKIKETLQRIGMASYKNGILYQSCHILHKKGRYYIVHFKEMFKLDGRPSSMTKQDYGIRNTISALLEDWGLLTIINHETLGENFCNVKKIKIIPYKDKDKWILRQKYNLGE